MHSSTVLSVFGLVASASAHMKLQYPKGWPVNNSPLDPSGSDFPCKGVDYNSASEVNVYAQGETAPLTFIGQAVHGGGSCQISLTTDTQPTKNSVWRVIKSIEGGCPAQGETGNMGGNAEAEDPYKYEFTIPNEVPAGNYTIAWTWFNKIGNREQYMNCGPAVLTGDNGDESFYNSLPEMFTANIGNGCVTADNADTPFPNPGQYVERLNGATNAFTSASGSGCQTAAAGSNGGNAASSPSPTAAPVNDDSGSASDELPGAVFATVSPSAEPTNAGNDAAETTAAAQPTQAAELPDSETTVDEPLDEEPAAEPTAEPAEESNSSSSSGGSEMPAGAPCTQDGYWNCIGGSSFQRCASGIWSATQQLAAGTSCSGGITENIALTKRGRPVKARRFGAKMRI